MKVIGLTGKTGAGKSTVAAFLKEKGCYIIDGDKIARDILLPGEAAVKELAAFFGEDIILADGTVDRKKVAARAFSSAESTAALNAITHPHITARFIADINKAENEGYEIAVIDAAALLESDCKKLCSYFVVVTAPEETRLKRILKRDDITKEQAQTRINAQKSDEYYFSQADYIVKNYAPYSIDEELEKLSEKLKL
ncbi:MAG: dephospho-CoA kinase [Clostridia bacterium]|nr:dephospho-CoA kinase [Clostridia bacterium]